MLVRKSVIILTVIVLLNAFLINSGVFAATTATDSAQQLCQSGDCPITSIQGIYAVLAKIVRYTYTAFFIVAVIFILLAAFSFLTAQGDPQKIVSARNQILWAAVAIAIALISVGAAQIIKEFITP